MDGNFSKYATESAGDNVGASVAALIGRASIPFAFTIRKGFCQSRASTTERYLFAFGGEIRSLSGDVPVSAILRIFADCEQETKAIAEHKKAASRFRDTHCILT